MLPGLLEANTTKGAFDLYRGLSREQKKSKKWRERERERREEKGIKVRVGKRSQRLFVAEDGCLSKARSNLRDSAPKIAVFSHFSRASSFLTFRASSHPLPAAPFETAFLIRSTERRRNSIPRCNSNLIKRHAHWLTFFRVLNRGGRRKGARRRN